MVIFSHHTLTRTPRNLIFCFLAQFSVFLLNSLCLLFFFSDKSLIADKLPSKEDRIVFCPLTEMQMKIYKVTNHHLKRVKGPAIFPVRETPKGV